MIRLTPDQLPRGCAGSNVRALVTPDQWRKLCRLADESTGRTCAACGLPSRDRHEMWQFADHTQTLTGVVTLCRPCHLTQHIGYAARYGHLNTVIAQLCNVNQIAAATAHAMITAARRRARSLSNRQWDLDLSLVANTIRLPEPYRHGRIPAAHRRQLPAAADGIW